MKKLLLCAGILLLFSWCSVTTQDNTTKENIARWPESCPKPDETFNGNTPIEERVCYNFLSWSDATLVNQQQAEEIIKNNDILECIETHEWLTRFMTKDTKKYVIKWSIYGLLVKYNKDSTFSIE